MIFRDGSSSQQILSLLAQNLMRWRLPCFLPILHTVVWIYIANIISSFVVSQCRWLTYEILTSADFIDLVQSRIEVIQLKAIIESKGLVDNLMDVNKGGWRDGL